MLQVSQNQGMRLILGVLRSTCAQMMRHQLQMLPVEYRAKLYRHSKNIVNGCSTCYLNMTWIITILLYTHTYILPYIHWYIIIHIHLLLSCHQTAFFHLSTHYLAFSLNFWRSSKVQGCASNGHCNICLVVLGAWPHLHVVSPMKYFHLFPWFLLHATPVRNLFETSPRCPRTGMHFAKLSSRLTAQLCDAKFCRCCHSLQWMTFAGKSTGRTELRKHFLVKRLSAGTWPCRECATFVSCFFFPNVAHTSLLMSDGAIPASRYSSSTLVGLRHLVIDLHAPVWKHVEI